MDNDWQETDAKDSLARTVIEDDALQLRILGPNGERYEHKKKPVGFIDFDHLRRTTHGKC